MGIKVWKKEFEGRELSVEHGRIAKQANGAILIRYADSALLVTATAAKQPKENIDFFPLTVEYQEKFYAAGKIPGGFIKREGRPGEEAVLSARLVDRPIRPLFPEGFFNEVQVVVTVLSVDPENDPNVWGMMGASLALNISDIPFNGIVAGVRVAYVNGEYIVMPQTSILEDAELDIVVAGTEDAITMVEGEAAEVSEDIMLRALKKAHEAIKALVAFEKSILSEFAPEKMEIPQVEEKTDVEKAFENLIDDSTLEERLLTQGKQNRTRAVEMYRDELIENVTSDIEEETKKNYIPKLKSIFGEYEKQKIRRMIIEKGIRIDSRKVDEIRPITCEVGIFPRTHGSALFTRGETQSLGVVTLGATIDEQVVDTLMEEGRKRFMLHYNFPPYSVGETRPFRGPGRREIGHGHLAERSVKRVLPPEEEFPYTIRIVSEILESNGSSSMATVCSASLSLMDAGVPIKEHVAGIAMGLIQEEDKTVILTDILGEEDHFGDMDFKVAGTRNGITGFQMDVKISGISEEIMQEALERAKVARLKILSIMEETISKPRERLSPYAPLISVMKISTDKIAELIGPGGRNVKQIIEGANVKVDIEQDGTVKVVGSCKDDLDKAHNMIEGLIREVKEGEIFEGVVTRIENYGAFVEILPSKVGLLHVSNLGRYVKNISQVMKIGDKIKVKVISTEDNGKIQLKLVSDKSEHWDQDKRLHTKQHFVPNKRRSEYHNKRR